jgi:hypothetical protein
VSAIQAAPHTAESTDSPEPAVRVWLRRTGQVAKVRIDGSDAAAWLRSRLPPGFACSEAEAVPGTTCFTFRVALGLSTTFARLQRAVGELPGATLMLDPA